MKPIRLILVILLATWIFGTDARSSFAAQPDLSTPESTIAAYFDGVVSHDFKAILAVSAADRMSKGLDFAYFVGRLGSLGPQMPAPSTDPFFVEINRSSFEAEFAFRLKFLAIGLMSKGDLLKGKMVRMDATGASEFMNTVQPMKLAGVTLIKVGIPNPTIINGTRYLVNAVKLARSYGAGSSTERLALIDFEGKQYVVGFTLLQYGSEWAILSQSSPIAGTNFLGVPEPVTPAAFDQMLQ